MSLKRGILETAQALGMSPATLATIISYETAGTFDPAKKGPTTQWGQHRGLIQFGEPQAKRYGVDWDDPVGSQLGADGAIVRYFQDNGWKPGMSELEAYSIVNAGAPGRYNASDANNAGAPGTVRDKVERQFAAHRKKAAGLLGGDLSFPNTPKMDPGIPTAKPGALEFPEQSKASGLAALLGMLGEEEENPWLGMASAMTGQQGQPAPPPRPGQRRAPPPDTFKRKQQPNPYMQGLLALLMGQK